MLLAHWFVWAKTTSRSVSPKDSEQNDSHNVILWADHRSIQEANEINETDDESLIFVGGKVSAEMQIQKFCG